MNHHRKIGLLRFVFKMIVLKLFSEKISNFGKKVDFLKQAWKIFSEDWLRWDFSFANSRKFIRHIWTSHTWWKSWMCPSVVILAFDSPSALWSPTLGTDGCTPCTIACDVTAIYCYWWFSATIVPLFIRSFTVLYIRHQVVRKSGLKSSNLFRTRYIPY